MIFSAVSDYCSAHKWKPWRKVSCWRVQWSSKKEFGSDLLCKPQYVTSAASFSPGTVTVLGRIKWIWFSLWSHGRNSLCCVYFGSVLFLSFQLQHGFQIPTKYAPSETGTKHKPFYLWCTVIIVLGKQLWSGLTVFLFCLHTNCSRN